MFVLLFSYLVLLVVMRSVLLPLKAVIMNLLSVGAAYGVLVIVFQYGWTDSLIGFDHLGYVNALTPPLVLATKRCVHPATSAKASSMEMRSMEGVKSLSTPMAASPSRWYSSKCPPTKTRSGQSCRARRPGMPLRTPKARAS